MDPEDQTLDGVGAEDSVLNSSSGAGETDPVTGAEVAGSEVVDVPEEAYPLVSGDDVFLPNPRTIVGLEDYYALKETLSWTNANYWPDIGQTDWVVLYDSAILTSETPTVSIVKGDKANLTITGGKNLIFLDSSELTINQFGGLSEIYYDPSTPAKINLNITDGVSALSQIAVDSPTVHQTLNTDGSRTLKIGAITFDYHTGADGEIFLSDLVSGSVVKVVSTFTLQDSSVPTNNETGASTVVESTVLPPQVAGGQGLAVGNAAKATRPKAPATVHEDDLLDIMGDTEEDPLTYFEDDVLLNYNETDIVSDYFSLSPQQIWKYAAEVYRASDELTINTVVKQHDRIQEAERKFEELIEDNAQNLDALLVMRQWEDLLIDEILDVFYVN